MKSKVIYRFACISLIVEAFFFLLFNVQRGNTTSVDRLSSNNSPIKLNESVEKSGFQPIRLTLVVSGEELSYLEPCGCAEGQLGGFPRRDNLIQQLKVKRENLLLVANGDLVAEANPQSALKAEIGFTALKEMGYTAFNVGEKDLLLGIERLKHLEKTSGIPFLSANLFLGNERVFQPFVIQTVDFQGHRLKVAIVGILSHRFEAQVQNGEGNLKLKAPKEVLNSLMGKLNRESELIILLAHADLDESKTLASAFPQINIVVSGHELDKPLVAPIFIGKTVLLNPGTQGKSLGQLEIRWDDDGKIASYDFQVLPLLERIPDSPRMVNLLAVYQQMLMTENLSDDLDRVPPSTGGVYVGSASCQSCHVEAYKIWKESKHSHSYHTLVEKKHAADPECLTCHTTGFSFQTGFLNLDQTPDLANVGCETCHGVGGNHVKNPQKGYGQVTKADCLTCHTAENSPKFDYGVYLPKIRH